MLIQLYKDNYSTTPTENLMTTVYNGFFDGIESWFDTATVLNANLKTSDLTSLATITKGLFDSTTAQSIKVSGFFRAKRTGTHRFYVGGTRKYILEIDDDDIIFKTSLTEGTNFANKSLIAGRYYSFNIYYGTHGNRFPPVAMTSNSLTVTGNFYGNGTYTANRSSASVGDAWRVFNLSNTDGLQWQSASGRYTSGAYSGAISTTTTQSPITGEWVQIQLPSAIILNRTRLSAASGGIPQAVTIVASNNGTTWQSIFNVADTGLTSLATVSYNITNTTAYSYYRLIIQSVKTNSYAALVEWLLATNIENFSCGYLEPNADGTNIGSTSPNDFITNATTLTTYYDINPETQSTEVSASYPLTYLDHSLRGLFKVSPLALYYNRTDFNEKGGILYIASDDLFNNFNGTYKNYIQLHDRPVYNDNNPRKKFKQFSSDMSFECELEGKIEVQFRRGSNEPVAWRYVMLVLDVEPIPIKKI